LLQFKKGDVALPAPVSHLDVRGIDASIGEAQAMDENY
jgi:hypothetical protein